MNTLAFAHDETPGLVSIVIPAHRAERLIGDTLESIGRQHYRHWEVIVVEDGPPGPTRAIVAEFARLHPENRVQYVCNGRNRGAGFSRNIGFSESAGEFIALLDSDDRWLPDHLAASVAALRSSGHDIVYSTAVMVADGTDLVLGHWGPTAAELEGLPQTLLGRSFVTPSATVMRRDVPATVGPMSTTHTYCEDFDFWLRCIATGKTFHYLGGCHCLYRKNHAGATTQRLCGTLTEVAETIEHHRHMKIPGVRPSRNRRYAAEAFARAARFHAHRDPRFDPSADPARAPALFLKAWRLRRRRLMWMLQSLWFACRQAIRGRRPTSPLPPATATPFAEHQRSAPRTAA